jgi:hypothetical protein
VAATAQHGCQPRGLAGIRFNGKDQCHDIVRVSMMSRTTATITETASGS